MLSLAWSLGPGAVVPALADSGPMLPRDTPTAYAQECGSCHLAYPPGLLPGRSWQRIMAGLDRHYGTDASLDEVTVGQLAGWLQRHAGSYKRVAEAPPDDRITRSVWFQRKHRDFDAAAWEHDGVRSAGNCAACHTGAEQGRFDDDHLRLPPGLGARYRHAFRHD